MKIKFKKEDFWIGVYWETINIKTDVGEKSWIIDFYVCIIPCFPIHFRYERDVSIYFDTVFRRVK